jgi:multiple sugar transport system substrate-binding protein
MNGRLKMFVQGKKRVAMIMAVAVCFLLGVYIAPVFAGGKNGKGEETGAYEGVTIRIIIDSLEWVAGQKVVAENFEKATGATVDILVVPYGELKEKIMLDLVSGGGTFDLVCPDGAWAGEIMASGYIEKLNDFIEDLKADPEYDFNDLVPGGLEFVQWDGNWYGIPSTLHSNAYLISRSDLLPNEGFSIPRTWTEFNEVAAFFTGYVNPETGEKMYGTVTPGERDDPIIMAWMNRMLSMGGSIDSKGRGALWNNEWKPTFQNGPGLESAELLMKHLTEYGPPGPTSVTWGTQVELYMAGRAAMVAAWDVNIAGFEDPKQSKVVGKNNYSTIPVKEGEELGGLLASRPYFIPKKAKNKEAAKAFIKFATSKEQDKLSVLNGSPAPIRLSNFEDPEVLEKWPSMREAKTIYSALISEPLIPEWSEIKEALGIALTQAVAGEKSIQNALNEAAGKVEQIFERGGYYR